MSQDEIIAMAKEARISEMGMNIDGSSYLLGLFERFAALVAAKEREVCAKVCDELAELNRTAPADSMWQWGECAAAIRARAQKDGA